MTTSSPTLSSTSLSGLGLTGLSSGLDTSSIVSKLMSIESAPQAQLQSQLTGLQTHTNALQSLNTAIASLASTAKAATTSSALSSFTATSSASSVTASASSTANAGSVSFTVTQLAAAQVGVTGAMSSWPDTSSPTPSITIQVGTGAAKTVQALSNNLDDVVAAINGSGTGVTASKIAAGSVNGVQQYKLQLSGATGAANGFTVYQGASTAGTPVSTTQISAAQDATLTLYAGTGADTQITSPTNTFKGLLTGVDATVTAVSASPVTLTIAADSTAATTSAQSLTAGLIQIFSGIAASSAITTSSSTSGGTSASSTSGSIFTGDPLVRNVNDALLSATSDPVNGKSPSTIGISLTKTGTITFDQGAFQAAMAADPVGTTAMYQAIAQRVSDAASAASDPYTGTITQSVTSEQSTQSSLSTQISNWTTRLAAIQAQYTAQFNAMETALNNLSAQSSYISGQINGFTTNYQNG